MHDLGQSPRVTCDNSSSLQWLTDQLQSAKIYGGDLNIVKVKDLPTLTKVSLWISSKRDKRDVVIGRIEVQNSDLKIYS